VILVVDYDLFKNIVCVCLLLSNNKLKILQMRKCSRVSDFVCLTCVSLPNVASKTNASLVAFVLVTERSEWCTDCSGFLW
jgi:hypothetical protein